MAPNITIKDGNLSPVILSTNESGGVHTTRHVVDSITAPVQMAAGSNLGGAMRTYPQADNVYVAGVAHQVKRVLFDTLLSGTTTVIPAVPGMKIRILALNGSYAYEDARAGALSSIQFTVGGALILAPIYLSSLEQTYQFEKGFNPFGWGESIVANTAVICTPPSFPGTKAVTGEISYIEVA